jgi:hypothetical protein
MPRRSLALRRERLAELSSDELVVMGGAVPPPTPVPPTHYCKPTLDIRTCIAVQSAKVACVTPILPTYYCTPMP